MTSLHLNTDIDKIISDVQFNYAFGPLRVNIDDVLWLTVSALGFVG